jgi:hypothetical protein
MPYLNFVDKICIKLSDVLEMYTVYINTNNDKERHAAKEIMSSVILGVIIVATEPKINQYFNFVCLEESEEKNVWEGDDNDNSDGNDSFNGDDIDKEGQEPPEQELLSAIQHSEVSSPTVVHACSTIITSTLQIYWIRMGLK